MSTYVAPVAPVGISLSRHALSSVVALVSIPVSYIALDLAVARGVGAANSTLMNEAPQGNAVAALLVSVLMLFVALLAARVSGFGPLVAGLLWGVIPAVEAIVAPVSMLKFLHHYSNLYGDAGVGLGTYGVIVFPLVTVALLGAAAAGRWRS